MTNIVEVGTYTPTLTNSTNVAASTVSVCQWMRIGNVVAVSGEVTIDPTSANTASDLRLSLPVSSNLSTTGDLGGTANSHNVFGYSSRILASPTDNLARFIFVSDGAAANAGFSFSFMYKII